MNTRAACAALAGARGQNGLRTGTPTGIFTLTLINTLLYPSRAGAVICAAATDGLPATVNLYDPLFADEQPHSGGRDSSKVINHNSLSTVHAIL